MLASQEYPMYIFRMCDGSSSPVESYSAEVYMTDRGIKTIINHLSSNNLDKLIIGMPISQKFTNIDFYPSSRIIYFEPNGIQFYDGDVKVNIHCYYSPSNSIGSLNKYSGLLRGEIKYREGPFMTPIEDLILYNNVLSASVKTIKHSSNGKDNYIDERVIFMEFTVAVFSSYCISDRNNLIPLLNLIKVEESLSKVLKHKSYFEICTEIINKVISYFF